MNIFTPCARIRVSQAQIRELLALDKGAAARRAANLEKKGYLIRKPNPNDGRSQHLYATEKADALKNSRAALEAGFYHWLLEDLPEDDRDAFTRILNTLYEKSKTESKNGFENLFQKLSCDENKLTEGVD
jgi:DNA-binding MarR family transcriptional regulator